MVSSREEDTYWYYHRSSFVSSLNFDITSEVILKGAHIDLPHIDSRKGYFLRLDPYDL